MKGTLYEINLNTDSYRLCQVKTAHDGVLGKVDASLAKKILRAVEAPHFDTKALIAKLDNVAKTVGLDVSTILPEQIKGPVLGTVRSSIRKTTSPEPKSPEIQQSSTFTLWHQSSTDSQLKEKDNFNATAKLLIN